MSPALPFSDVTFRRYYDHALAYTDFKEASKSDDKHCLYLGLLSGPPFAEAVVYHKRERLLDQIVEVCVALGKSPPFEECEVGPLLPPIQGDPFDLDEVRLFLYYLRNFVIFLSCSDEGVGRYVRHCVQRRKDEISANPLPWNRSQDSLAVSGVLA